MDKHALKRYAVWARRELMLRVGQRAVFYGVTESDYGDAEADSVNGRVLSPLEKNQRKALIAQIQKKGYQEKTITDGTLVYQEDWTPKGEAAA